MRQVFLSHFLWEDTPFYGGDGCFQVEPLRSMTAGDSCNASRWCFPNHAGTHIDLPRHFALDGKCVEDYPADFWVFSAVAMIDISDIQAGVVIGPELLKKFKVEQDVTLLLIKTGFGKHRAEPLYWRQNPVFRPELADYLRSRFPLLRVLGFDSISVSSWTDRATGREAHRKFLGGERPILLVEDMDLMQIGAGEKIGRVTLAPLLVRGADASPCTVIAEVIS